MSRLGIPKTLTDRSLLLGRYGSGNGGKLASIVIEPIRYFSGRPTKGLYVSGSLFFCLVLFTNEVTSTDDDGQVVDQIVSQHADGVMAFRFLLVHTESVLSDGCLAN